MNELISGLVTIVLVSWALWSWRRRKKEGSFASVEDMMGYLAGEAAKIAGEDHGTVLDYSEKSVMEVEKILGGLHEQYPLCSFRDRRKRLNYGLWGLPRRSNPAQEPRFKVGPESSGCGRKLLSSVCIRRSAVSLCLVLQ